MNLSIIIPVISQPGETKLCLDLLLQNSETNPEIIIIDNGGKEKFADNFPELLGKVKLIRHEENIGLLSSVKEGIKQASNDIVMFTHNDVYIYDKGWDTRVLDEFKKDEHLGLLSFCGGTGLAPGGGRIGFSSNMQGRSHTLHTGEEINLSNAKVHGRKMNDYEVMDSAVVDGCVMILDKKVVEKCGGIYQMTEGLTEHHFYDKQISVEIILNGFRVKTLGIPFDHQGGVTSIRGEFMDWAKVQQKKDGERYQNVDAGSYLYRLSEDAFLKKYNPKLPVFPN